MLRYLNLCDNAGTEKYLLSMSMSMLTYTRNQRNDLPILTKFFFPEYVINPIYLKTDRKVGGQCKTNK